MWEALTRMYQSTNENRKMVLREKMKSIWIAKIEGVISYLTRITRVRDELSAVGEAVGEAKLVRTALNGVSKPWAMLVQAIVGRENLSSWERLWDDFIQEETRRGYLRGSSSSVKKEENVALSAKWSKGKPKTQGPTSPSKQQGKPKKKGEKDLSKVKCWCYQKMGHYAVTCLERKKKKVQNMAAST
jgi:hypothetical protein